ncbi:hypothetical protein CLU79DRAFT_743673 [Phycomyces nitens]|nr:hypothetical protein CLU79DRAFT_743673 [Phycomyces nitens]
MKYLPTKDDGKKRLPIILMPWVLIQSHIYWCYSVLYCICQPSHSNPPTRRNSLQSSIPFQHPTNSQGRARAFSDPTSQPAAPIRSVQETNKNGPKNNRRFIDTFHRRLRRNSTDLSRPTIQQERDGTTLPPLWIQKARHLMGSSHTNSSQSLSSSDCPGVPNHTPKKHNTLLQKLNKKNKDPKSKKYLGLLKQSSIHPSN